MENFRFFQNAIADDSDKHLMFNVYDIYSLDLFSKLDHLRILWKKFMIMKWSGLQSEPILEITQN